MKPIIAMSGIKDGNMSFEFNGQGTNHILNVRKNRKRFLEKIGVPEDRVFYMDTKHGTKIEQVGNRHLKIRNEFSDILGITCDGLYTTQKGIALAFTPADCMPIFFWNKKVIALVHAGRSGIIEEMPLKMLLALKSKGLVDINDPLKVQIGHHIMACCYRFPMNFFWEWGYKFAELVSNGDSFPVSLHRKLRYFLSNQYICGVTRAPKCTCCSRDNKGDFEYFSHTRSNNDRFPGDHLEGRNMAIIMMREENQ